MQFITPSKIVLTLTASFIAISGTVTVQSAGVAAGLSSLIGAYDYTDTFTGTTDGGINPNRPYIAAVQGAPAYIVENTYGHPSVNFQSNGMALGVAEFSIASDTQGQVPGGANPVYPGTSGAGSATGFTQTGNSVDYGLPYGFRSEYVVQVDAVQLADRIDISSGAGIGIFAPNALSVFFRGSGGGISLYNGVDTPVPGFNTGITGPGQWLNYAVRYDMIDREIEVYVNQVSRGIIDLDTFAGGIYANFSNAFVGAGGGLGAGENRTWTDNFQVGGAIPEPSSAILGLSALGLMLQRRRR